MSDLPKHAAEKAYNAGHALPSVVWPEEVAPELRYPGVHHCPFSPGDPQRAEWLRGLKDALQGPQQDPASIIKDIEAEL